MKFFQVLLGQHSNIETICISHDDTKIAAGGLSGIIKLWDVGKIQSKFKYRIKMMSYEKRLRISLFEAIFLKIINTLLEPLCLL